ncbi:hypothetical protein [Streptomyces sp. NPDC002535]
MDPTIKGALIGALATAVGAAIALLGARSQARAALEAVRLQARTQRMDGIWQMRRAAYSELLNSVEVLRGKIGTAAEAVTEASRHRGRTVSADVARSEAHAAQAEMLVSLAAMNHQCTVLGLSVTPLEAQTAESFASVVSGVAHDLTMWADAALAFASDRDQLHERFRDRMDALPQTIDHFIDMSRGYLHTLEDVAPTASRRRRGWRRRSRD